MSTDYSMLPEHMRRVAENWVEYGLEGGGFFTSILHDSLSEAWYRADEINREHLAEWGQWLCGEAPANCWGHADTVNAWRDARKPQRDAMIQGANNEH